MGRFTYFVDGRRRLARSLSDASPRAKHKDNNSPKGTEKLVSCNQENMYGWRLRWLKCFIAFFMFGTLYAFLHSTIKCRETSSIGPLRPSASGVKWMGSEAIPDPRYASGTDIKWPQIMQILSKINGMESLRIGLLNFHSSEMNRWRTLFPAAKISDIHLAKAEKNLTWEELYPEWIDEEDESEVPSCKNLPNPTVEKESKFGLVGVKLPCNKAGNWTRDVARLHLQLAAARLIVSDSAQEEDYSAYVLIVTDCLPIPNLFSCKHLVARTGNGWLYKPDPRNLEHKLLLPVGSCQLSLPLRQTEARKQLSSDVRREAYATILHSVDVYVCGAIAAGQSIRLSGSTRDLVILVDEAISTHNRRGLEAAGWKIKKMRRIRNPKASKNAYNEWNYSKFRLWQLTQYSKVIFIDADLLVLRNIDFLFSMPEISASGNNGTLFNSGVMVIEPSACTFSLLMDNIHAVDSYNGGDQGYLNEIFTWWHRIPRRMNFLKHFWSGDSQEKKDLKNGLFEAEPPVLYLIHYLGLKPWLCFRDYDCNWNVDFMREFASDVAHKRWWDVHDLMPKTLHKFCFLSTRRKAGLEWDRRLAEKKGFLDGHWKTNVSDSRLSLCRNRNCDWKAMLLHWKDTRYANQSLSFKRDTLKRNLSTV